MQTFVQSFAGEIVKLAVGRELVDRAYREARSDALNSEPGILSSLRGSSAPRSRDYLSSALIGAAATPALGLVAKSIGRALRNKSIRHAMATASGDGRLMLEQQLERGPLLGKFAPTATIGELTLFSHDELLSQGAVGGLMGSAVQALRDRFAGSVSVETKR